MSEIRKMIGELIDKGVTAADIMQEVVSCVYDNMSCDDCLSEINISRIVTSDDAAHYLLAVLHDDTCPTLEGCECGDCPD